MVYNILLKKDKYVCKNTNKSNNMSKPILLFLAVILWMATVLDTSLGSMLYLVWIMAFVLSIYSYSTFFAIEALLASVSFYFIDTASNLFFLSTTLPWIFGFLAVLFLFMVGGYYLSYRSMEYVHDYSEKNDVSPRTPWLFF